MVSLAPNLGTIAVGLAVVHNGEVSAKGQPLDRKHHAR